MRKATLVRVQADLESYIEQCQTRGPLVITRRGKPIGVLTAAESRRKSSSRRASMRTMEEVLREAEADVASGRVILLEDAWKVVRKRHAEQKQKGNGKKRRRV